MNQIYLVSKQKKGVYIMKKIFSRILAITLIITLFSSPSVAKAATILPILTQDSGSFREYDYSPYYNVTSQTTLTDITTTNGQWFVPAGKTFNFECNLNVVSSFTVYIFQNDQIFLTLPMTAGHFANTFTPKSFDAYYKIIIVPSSSNVAITQYFGWWDAPSSSPTFLDFGEGIKLYSYSPNAYQLLTHQSLTLYDQQSTYGRWNVPAGKIFRLDLGITGTFRVGIYDASGNIVHQEVATSTGGGYIYDIPAKTSTQNYFIFVEAYSTSSIIFYGGSFLN